jgi:biotin operon repressor
MRQPDALRMKQLRRTFLVIAILRSRGGTSLETLARECGVTTRTSRRDLIALENAGFPIFTVGEWGARLYRFPRGIACPICGKDVTTTSRPQRERMEASA